MSVKVRKFERNKDLYYGRWLPTPLIDKISVSDDSIEVQVAIMLNPVGDVYDPSTPPSEIFNNFDDKASVYVFWAFGDSTHKALTDYTIPAISMISSSAGMEENFGSLLGGHANYQIAEFDPSGDPEEYSVDSVPYYKYTTSVTLQIGATDGTDYKFNPVSGDYIWGSSYFDLSAYEDDEDLLEKARQYFLNMHVYSMCISKEDNEEDNPINGIFSSAVASEQYAMIDSDRMRYNMICSDVSYLKLFKPADEENFAVLDNDPKVVFMDDPASMHGIHLDVPIMGLDGFYYMTNSVSFEDVANTFVDMFGQTPQLTDSEMESLELGEGVSAVSALKYVYHKFMYTPRILVELNNYLKVWPDKNPSTPQGGVYMSVRNAIERLNRSFNEKDRVEKRLMHSTKIVDARGQENLAEWCSRHKTFMGKQESPYIDISPYHGDLGSGLISEGPPGWLSYTGHYSVLDADTLPVDVSDPLAGELEYLSLANKYNQVDDVDDYVIYPQHYMHRVGVNRTSPETGYFTDEYFFDYMQNKGYWFIDIERIINNYLLVSQIWAPKQIEALFGRDLVNYFLGDTQEVQMARYNSKLYDAPAQLTSLSCFMSLNGGSAAPAFNAGTGVAGYHEISGNRVARQLRYNRTYDSISGADVYAEDVGTTEVQISYTYDSSTAGSEYKDFSHPQNYRRYPYIIPRNFDLISKDFNLTDTLGGYRLLCMAYEEYYPFETALWGADSFADVGDNEFYYVTFRLNDRSFEFIWEMVNALLEVRNDYEEYVELCTEACTFNHATGNFNEFFTSAVTFDEAKVTKALQLYAVHLQLLYGAFGSAGIEQSRLFGEISAFVDSMLPLISAQYGNLESILMFKESIDSLCEYYVGAGYASSAENDVDVWSEAGAYTDGSATSIFYRYKASLYDRDATYQIMDAPGLAMQFDNILECWPNVIMSEYVSTGLESEDLYQNEYIITEIYDTGWEDLGRGLNTNTEDEAIANAFKYIYNKEDESMNLGDDLSNFSDIDLEKDDLSDNVLLISYVLAAQWVLDWIEDHDYGDLDNETLALGSYSSTLVMPIQWVMTFVEECVTAEHSGGDESPKETYGLWIRDWMAKLEDECVYEYSSFQLYGFDRDMLLATDWTEPYYLSPPQCTLLAACPVYMSYHPVIVVDYMPTDHYDSDAHRKDKAYRIRAFTSNKETTMIGTTQYYSANPSD
jgi:hypothetical protein